MFNNMGIDSLHYKWCNERIIDYQESFNLFDNVLNIIIDGPGIGGVVSRSEGIDFIIKTKEQSHEHLPHVHVEYGGEKIRVSLIDLEILDNKTGFKSNKKTKIALSFIKDNREWLLNKWEELTGYKVSLDVKFSI